MSDLHLPGYLSRVGLTGGDLHDRPRADRRSLRRLHAAHLAAIPFENLDVRLERPLRLDLESLQSKLVQRRRGGYCFEQNTLFAAVLRALGYSVRTLEARVRPPGAVVPLPRTHMVLEVEAEGEAWLADVGFGGDGPLYPVPLDGTVSGQPMAAYAVEREPGELYVLRIREEHEWRDLYAFLRTPALAVDFEVASHYTSTHPTSPFVNTLTVQHSTKSERVALRGRRLSERRGDAGTVRELSDSEIVDFIVSRLELDVTPEEVLRALGRAAP